MGQEECPLSLTEDLPLFRIDSERIKKDCSYWKQGHSDSISVITQKCGQTSRVRVRTLCNY